MEINIGSTMNIYCISGLGADERVFQHLSILNHKLIHVNWVTPAKNESITAYSQRLAEQININKPFILLGLSFGGTIACEMAQFLAPEKVIHISSITNKSNLPFVFKLIGQLGIVHIIPANWLRPPIHLAYWFFGVKKNENKILLKAIFKDTDQQFLKWALIQLLSKKQIPAVENLIRIHGTNDRLLPLQEESDVIKIEHGGHFMVMEQANEVNEELNRINSNN